ncbi:MAG: DUF169 domain-containing protein [Chloroflexi bacterium]|nr:DUF169 domain-containing protein [Chloroflexota bacterium]
MNAETQRRIAKLQETLNLSRPPIGLAFVNARPPGVALPDAAVPSACSFWILGARQVFYADLARHANCPVGLHTMGFQAPKEKQEELMDLVGTMVKLEYIEMQEVASIPTVQKPHQGIVYGPLAQMPVDPDAALFICTPAQAMLLAEASGKLAWTGGGATAFGRPTCATIPLALKTGNPSMSMGCVGFRVYTQIPDQEMVVTFPGKDLPDLLSKMDTIANANSALEEFHMKRRAAF